MFQQSETSDTIRTVDPLGRIVLPKKVRLALGVEAGDTVQIQPVEGGFLLTRGPAACAICGREEKDMKPVGNGFICGECRKEDHKTPAE